MDGLVLTNARLILPDRTVEGSVVLKGNRIGEVLPGRSYSDGRNLHGQFLAPGIIDSHTDYLEKELAPRPDTHFPLEMAFHLMDLRAIGCGVTTVLGGARVSGEMKGPLGTWNGDGLQLIREYARLRSSALARHYIHVRWDTNFEPCTAALDAIEEYASVVGNLVYNESIPGERQFRNTVEDQVRRHAIHRGISFEESLEQYRERARIARTMNNRAEVATRFSRRLPLGSHDDTTVEHVEEAHATGCSLAEMPVTLEAARRAKELGMAVCMGAPNYYRGGSHCGNLSCSEALAEGLVDMLCSDYHFPSMLGSAVRMMETGVAPHEAFRLMTAGPAEHLGFAELGRLEEGALADLVAFSARPGYGLVTQVWVDGEQKFELPDSAVSTPIDGGYLG
jgi:alpha-D-ribose 1-methylphosphonate 5-triphosphate diphosphatase